ncbi:MAG: hypothetical protein ACI4EB_05550 [Bilifractor sp.]
MRIHGYYRRFVKASAGKMALRILRLRCTECGRTHAVLLSSINYAVNAFAFTRSIALRIPIQTLRSVKISTTLPMALNGAS